MAAKDFRKNLSIENARIGFRNFSGREGQFNPKGRRNFVVFLDDENAKNLGEDGWNVRFLKPRDLDEEPQAYLPVDVAFEHYPPRVVLITSHGKTELDDETVNILDLAEIKSTDLIIRPYSWEVGEKSGIKAYLKTMYVTIVEDEFEAKYRDVPDGFSTPIDEQEN